MFIKVKPATAISFSARPRCVVFSCGGLTLLIMGQVEDTNQQGFATQLAQQGEAPTQEDDGDDDVPELEAVDESGEVDETGVNEHDVGVIMGQVRCQLEVRLFDSSHAFCVDWL